MYVKARADFKPDNNEIQYINPTMTLLLTSIDIS